MPAPLSIVIPTLNAARDLPATLHCLMEGVSSGLVGGLIISDGGSSDATLAIADAAGALVVEGARGRGGQLLRGAKAASRDWLLFLHADSHLSEGWSATVEHHIQTFDGAGVFRLRFRAKGLAPALVAGWANLRSRLGLPYGDQGLLISRDLYDRIGGYPDIPLMEDVAIARQLRGHFKLLQATSSTSAERYLRNGWLRRGAWNLWTLVQFLAGASPQRLYLRYHGRPPM